MNGVDDENSWPLDSVPTPSWWNPDGILGGLTNPAPAGGLEMLMSPKDLADAGIGQDVGGGGRGSSNNPPATSHQPIGAMPGYPETGNGAWRGELDDQFRDAASRYNATYGYKAGDPNYMTPELMKSWAMQESGGDRRAFESDPLQVNKRADWDPHKADFGMSLGQVMTPQSSIDGGLDWLRYKATKHGDDGAPVGYRDLPIALERYNGNQTIDKNGLAHQKNYINSILGRIGSGHGDRGQ